jgi:hypothetical protein
MTDYRQSDAYQQASDWLVGTAKRNPEALLVLAAGCALLLRKRGSSSTGSRNFGVRTEGGYEDNRETTRDQISRIARDATNQATETATSYASSVVGYADDVRHAVSSQASDLADTVTSQTSRLADQASALADQAGSKMRSSAQSMLQEQPLAIAALGLAAGAALAAIFPTTELEEKALQPARDAVAGAASRMGENLVEAAQEATDRLKQSAADRGLNAEGIKEMARGASETFTTRVAGRTETPTSGNSVGESHAGRSRPAGNASSNRPSSIESPNISPGKIDPRGTS